MRIHLDIVGLSTCPRLYFTLYPNGTGQTQMISISAGHPLNRYPERCDCTRALMKRTIARIKSVYVRRRKKVLYNPGNRLTSTFHVLRSPTVDKLSTSFDVKIFILPEWIYPVAKQTENNKLINLTININSQHIQHDEVGNASNYTEQNNL